MQAAGSRAVPEDKRAGAPWATKLPFVVHVVEKIETYDGVSNTRLVSTYRYHHGYYDHAERELRGFGMVEARDAESYLAKPDAADPEFHLPPLVTKSWFHLGAWREEVALERAFSTESFRGDALAEPLERSVIPAGLRVEEKREALRALRGRMLRQEVFAEDGDAAAANPYSVMESRAAVRLEQPKDDRRHAVVFAYDLETVTTHYERDPSDPRVGHTLALEVDDYGTVTRSAVVSYPRRVPLHPEQGKLAILMAENDVAHLDATRRSTGSACRSRREVMSSSVSHQQRRAFAWRRSAQRCPRR